MIVDELTSDARVVRRQQRRLGELTGISEATGTVLLTFRRPDVYTEMDERVLGTLANAGFWTGYTEATLDDYPQYLDKCRSISTETGVNLQDSERALWVFAR